MNTLDIKPEEQAAMESLTQQKKLAEQFDRCGYVISPGVAKFMNDLEVSNSQLAAAYIAEKNKLAKLNSLLDELMQTSVKDIFSMAAIKRKIQEARS